MEWQYNEEFKAHMEELRMFGLERLQKDGFYLLPFDDGEDGAMNQEDLQRLFDSSDWLDGVTAFYQDIVNYLEVNR